MPEVISLSPGELEQPLIRTGIGSIGRMFVAEAKYPFPFADAHFFEQWRNLIRHNIGEFLTVLDETGCPIGVFGCLFVQDLFSGVMTGTELFWFIRPEWRKSRVGLQMFRTFEKCCDKRGCKMRVMAHISGLNDDALSRLYARCGYNTAEHFFRKVV